MKRKRNIGSDNFIKKTLFSHIQDELRNLAPEELKKLREDSEKNALLVEEIKRSINVKREG